MKTRIFLTRIIFAVVVLTGCATTEEQIVVRFAPLDVAAGHEQISDRFTPLHLAVRDGDDETVIRLLRQGEDFNAASTVNGVTPLILAVTLGREQIVDVLLDAGANVNSSDQLGGTALMYASSKGHTGMLNKLLQRGADVNRKSPKNFLDSTALTLATGNGQDMVLTPLLKAGADIDWRTERDGLSALMLAAELGHSRAARILLSAGANPDLTNRQGDTACTLAMANGQEAVTKVLDEFYLSQGHGGRCRGGTK